MSLVRYAARVCVCVHSLCLGTVRVFSLNNTFLVPFITSQTPSSSPFGHSAGNIHDNSRTTRVAAAPAQSLLLLHAPATTRVPGANKTGRCTEIHCAFYRPDLRACIGSGSC